MKVIYGIVLLLLTISSAFSQSGWKKLNPNLTANTLRGQHFVNLNTGYVVGNSGTILKTTNEGYDWTTQQISSDSNSYINLTTVNFITPDIGFAAGAIGSHGVLLSTTNGGMNWNRRVFVDKYYFTSVKFISPEIGFLVGTGGILLRTTDMGNSWIQMTFGTSNITSFNANSPLVLWVGVSNESLNRGFIFKSTDGTHWDTQQPFPIGCAQGLNSVFPLSSSTCWGVGDNGTIVITYNGGVSYDCLTRFSNEKFNSISFNSNNLGLIVSSTGKIFRTSNAGVNWTIMNSGTNSELNSIEFVTETRARIIGQGGTILYTQDGGLTWNSQSNENKFVGSFKSVFFISNLTGWISGSNGTIFKTVNGGINFIQQEKVTTKNLNSIRFISDQTGFAVGDSGIILKTINGGSNWQLQTTTTNKNLQSVFMLSADSAWISGLEGTILKTSTGGSSWIICNSTTTDHLFSIYISDNGIGSSSGRQIVRTTDFGNSWVVTLPTPPNYLLSLNFPSDSVGYAAGRFWSYKTVNQGSTWNRILGSSTGGQDFSSVYFTSENTGYMVGASGEIKTTNGGNNWFSVEDGYNNVLNSVFFSSALTGWAVGDDGLILKTTSGGLVSLNENHTITVNEYILNQNYPNPFNPTTKINFSIPTTRYTILKVYDVLGKEVQTLVNQKLAPGNYEVEFDGSDFSSGIYFYRLETEDYSVAKRMLLTK